MTINKKLDLKCGFSSCAGCAFHNQFRSKKIFCQITNILNSFDFFFFCNLQCHWQVKKPSENALVDPKRKTVFLSWKSISNFFYGIWETVHLWNIRNAYKETQVCFLLELPLLRIDFRREDFDAFKNDLVFVKLYSLLLKCCLLY